MVAVSDVTGVLSSSMSDTPPDVEAAIDPTDPLVEHFAFQHDFRERYQHALEEICKVDMSQGNAHVLMRTIAEEALDLDKIREWQKQGRPLPWMDAEINPLAERIRDEVLQMLGLK